MPSKPRRQPKPPSRSPTTSTTTPLPAPFTPAPSTLSPFLPPLSRNHIYLLSLDLHPPAFKRRIFAVPLLLNIFLTVLLLYRLHHALPTYFAIFLSLLGYDSVEKVDVDNLARVTLLQMGLRRAAMFVGDAVLFRFVGMWPWGFFFGREGEPGPVGWRRNVVFRAVEIVVRRSRRWDGPLFARVDEEGEAEFMGGVRSEWVEQGVEGVEMRERVVPAVGRRAVSKTGYAMLDQHWDLYFEGMVRAHRLVDAGEMGVESFRNKMLVHSLQWGWLVWEVWRTTELVTEDEGTRKLQAIKDRLTGMGKENLFFRWIEVVQSETNAPGGFTAERREKAVRNVREEFERQGVDFEEFWGEVGGVENMPGMELTG